jgi:hypothetical protein
MGGILVDELHLFVFPLTLDAAESHLRTAPSTFHTKGAKARGGSGR